MINLNTKGEKEEAGLLNITIRNTGSKFNKVGCLMTEKIIDIRWPKYLEGKP